RDQRRPADDQGARPDNCDPGGGGGIARVARATERGAQVSDGAPMSQPAEHSAPAPVPGSQQAQWNRMIARASESGVVSADEVSELLREVELTGDVLLDVHTDLAARGIRIAEPGEGLRDVTVADDEDE